MTRAGSADTPEPAEDNASAEELDYEDVWGPVADEMEVGGL